MITRYTTLADLAKLLAGFELTLHASRPDGAGYVEVVLVGPLHTRAIGTGADFVEALDAALSIGIANRQTRDLIAKHGFDLTDTTKEI